MKNVFKRLVLVCGLLSLSGCSVSKSETFTFTAELPPDVYYHADAVYVPAKGETCRVPGGKNTWVEFNRHWRKEYKPDSKIALYRTVSGCPLVISHLRLQIYATYGTDRGDFGVDNAGMVVREELPVEYIESFNALGESVFYGQCQWLFRTSGKPRVLRKILDCKDTDATGALTRGRPVAGYTLDQLPGKTVKMKIKLLAEERPYMGDTWVKVPNGWKRCMGKGFEDPYAFCRGNYKDFSHFMMPDGKQCTVYPGCTE